MLEIEVKILNIDPIVVRERIQILGGRQIFDGTMQATLYDYPNRLLDAEGSFVRLRSKGEVTELAYKKAYKSDKAMTYQELEVTVSDRSVASDILKAIGLFPTVVGRPKHRSSFSLGTAHIEIDTLEGMPPFIEIEVHDEAELEGIVTALGYSPADARPWSVKDVYNYYQEKYPAL